MRALLGRIFDRLTLPGFVRDTDYDASIAEVSVKVRTDSRSTVVTINGIDVYFDRVSGTLHGVGYSGGHRWRVASRSGRLAASVWP